MKTNINNYPGSKGQSGVIPRIINNVPEHSYFIDMCAGSGKVGFAAYEHFKSTVILCEKYQPVFQQLEKKVEVGFMLEARHIDSIEYYYDRLSDGNDFQETIFYLDPPYLKSTRKDTRDIYGCEWDENDHYRMLNLVNLLTKNTNAYIMINHYDCDLYRENLKGWFTEEYTTMTRGGKTTDKLWMNYDIAELDLATTVFLGKKFTDRQRIKRKKISLENKLRKMPRHERQAMLEHIRNINF